MPEHELTQLGGSLPRYFSTCSGIELLSSFKFVLQANEQVHMRKAFLLKLSDTNHCCCLPKHTLLFNEINEHLQFHCIHPANKVVSVVPCFTRQQFILNFGPHRVCCHCDEQVRFALQHD